MRACKLCCCCCARVVKIEIKVHAQIHYLPFPANSPQPADAYKFFQPDILSAVGIIAFAFMCHHNTFLIYQSMEDSSFEKWERVTHFSVGWDSLEVLCEKLTNSLSCFCLEFLPLALLLSFPCCSVSLVMQRSRPFRKVSCMLYEKCSGTCREW